MHLVNSYAVVAYFDSTAAELVDRLRRQFNPGCSDRAHVTVLPPRPLYMDKAEAIRECSRLLRDYPAFQIRLGEVSLFETTQVIKIGIAEGSHELITLHELLNQGAFRYAENFEYVPHVTLGKHVPCSCVEEFLTEARFRWGAEQPEVKIDVDTLTFVQQRSDGSWKDVAELPLAAPVPVPAAVSR